MSIKHWDQTYNQLVNHIREFEQPFDQESFKTALVIQQKLVALVQYEAAIESLKQDVDYARSKHLKPRSTSGAIIHWAGVLAELLSKTYHKSASYLAKKFWMLLIRARITQSGGNDLTLIDDTDLMAMGTRELELKALEKQLNKDLHALTARKRDLMLAYHQVDTCASNSDAASSMQTTIRDAMGNATRVNHAFEAFVGNLSTETSAAAKAGSTLDELQRKLVKNTDKVVIECRDILAHDIDANKMTVGSERIKKLQDDLSDLSKLQDQIEELRKSLAKVPLPVLRPKLVKGSSIGFARI